MEDWTPDPTRLVAAKKITVYMPITAEFAKMMKGSEDSMEDAFLSGLTVRLAKDPEGDRCWVALGPRNLVDATKAIIHAGGAGLDKQGAERLLIRAFNRSTGTATGAVATSVCFGEVRWERNAKGESAPVAVPWHSEGTTLALRVGSPDQVDKLQGQRVVISSGEYPVDGVNLISISLAISPFEPTWEREERMARSKEEKRMAVLEEGATTVVTVSNLKAALGEKVKSGLASWEAAGRRSLQAATNDRVAQEQKRMGHNVTRAECALKNSRIDMTNPEVKYYLASGEEATAFATSVKNSFTFLGVTMPTPGKLKVLVDRLERPKKSDEMETDEPRRAERAAEAPRPRAPRSHEAGILAALDGSGGTLRIQAVTESGEQARWEAATMGGITLEPTPLENLRKPDASKAATDLLSRLGQPDSELTGAGLYRDLLNLQKHGKITLQSIRGEDVIEITKVVVTGAKRNRPVNSKDALEGGGGGEPPSRQCVASWYPPPAKLRGRVEGHLFPCAGPPSF